MKLPLYWLPSSLLSAKQGLLSTKQLAMAAILKSLDLLTSSSLLFVVVAEQRGKCRFTKSCFHTHVCFSYFEYQTPVLVLDIDLIQQVIVKDFGKFNCRKVRFFPVPSPVKHYIHVSLASSVLRQNTCVLLSLFCSCQIWYKCKTST